MRERVKLRVFRQTHINLIEKEHSRMDIYSSKHPLTFRAISCQIERLVHRALIDHLPHHSGASEGSYYSIGSWDSPWRTHQSQSALVCSFTSFAMTFHRSVCVHAMGRGGMIREQGKKDMVRSSKCVRLRRSAIVRSTACTRRSFLVNWCL